MLAERRTIEEKGKSLIDAEKEAVNDIDAANELLSDRTIKLSSSAVDQQGATVASLMNETAKANLEKMTVACSIYFSLPGREGISFLH